MEFPRPAAVVTEGKAWAGLLVGWLGLSVAVATFFEPRESRVLTPLIAGLIGLVGIWRPWPLAWLAASVLLSALFIGVNFLADGLAGLTFAAAIGTVSFVGVGYLADALARCVEKDEIERRHEALLIEELTPIHESGALKWQHAARLMAEELGRARRYRYPVTLALFGIDNPGSMAEESGQEAARLSQLAEVVLMEVRPTDYMSPRGESGVATLFPHTPLSGAEVVVERCRARASQQLQAEIRAGMAEFPVDGATLEELLREAESALDFARTARISVASPGLLKM